MAKSWRLKEGCGGEILEEIGEKVRRWQEIGGLMLPLEQDMDAQTESLRDDLNDIARTVRREGLRNLDEIEPLVNPLTRTLLAEQFAAKALHHELSQIESGGSFSWGGRTRAEVRVVQEGVSRRRSRGRLPVPLDVGDEFTGVFDLIRSEPKLGGSIILRRSLMQPDISVLGLVHPVDGHPLVSLEIFQLER